MFSNPMGTVFARRRSLVSWKLIWLFAALTIGTWLMPTAAPHSAPRLRADESRQAAGQEASGRPGVANDLANGDPQNAASDQGAGESGSTAADAGSAAHHDPSAHGEGGGHPPDPVAELLLAITIVLLAARSAGELFERFHQPAVLGELTVGILLGNWKLLTGFDAFTFLKVTTDGTPHVTATVLDMLSRIGVVLLLFEVGLETRVKDMLAVGASSLLVAVLGVVVPMVLGFAVGYLLLSSSLSEWQVPAFLGATLCATSVGITARVLRDLSRSRDPESRIILGAAVIDDVLGLIVLAVVAGVIREGDRFQLMSLVRIVGLSAGFLVAAMGLGALHFPRALFRAASYLHGHGMLIVTALVICFMFSWASSVIGLAPIIGAFAAGLILEGAHYQSVSQKWAHHQLEESLAPISTLLVPIFFVVMGMSVDLAAFGNPSVWLLAAGLTSVAVLGKLACYFGVLDRSLNRLAVAVGMIPRGEVGLIFAQEGAKLTGSDGQPVIGVQSFSAIVVMVMITTMVTPPLLKWVLRRPGTSLPNVAEPAP